MPVTGKKMPSALEFAERMSIIESATQLGEAGRSIVRVSTTVLAAILDREPRAIEQDRKKLRDARELKLPVDPLHPCSIPFGEPTAEGREIEYYLSDVIEFLQRRSASVDRSHLPGHDPVSVIILPRGIHRWMSEASPAETWGFSIQPDGRPMDLSQAIATSNLTENAERLTLREFGTRLADASSASFHDSEAAALWGASASPGSQN